MLDGRPTFTRLGFEQNRLSRRSSPVTNGNTQPNHNILSSSQSFSSSSNNNSSSTGPGNPHNLRASILDHSCLPQRDSGSSHPRRHSLTSNLILSKTSLPARPSASGRLTSPAGAAMGSAHDVQQLPSNTSNVGREGLLLSTRGNGGLKPTGTKPAADGAPSRIGMCCMAGGKRLAEGKGALHGKREKAYRQERSHLPQDIFRLPQAFAVTSKLIERVSVSNKRGKVAQLALGISGRVHGCSISCGQSGILNTSSKRHTIWGRRKEGFGLSSMACTNTS
eukprot:1140878-Pelagomonas_calceolata.AAC.2